ncbi:hypothetical protein FACS1894186_4410 [Alphaproteobacteria bacterium]|nr:hypothetical protein FACS1894186_4410 [Alphaproteobacteria bacterium]
MGQKHGQAGVKIGDIFLKVGKVGSHWVVDRIMEYPDIPAHVRLVEQGGNERTVTVALSTLDNAKFWTVGAAKPAASARD